MMPSLQKKNPKEQSIRFILITHFEHFRLVFLLKWKICHIKNKF